MNVNKRIQLKDLDQSVLNESNDMNIIIKISLHFIRQKINENIHQTFLSKIFLRALKYYFRSTTGMRNTSAKPQIYRQEHGKIHRSVFFHWYYHHPFLKQDKERRDEKD